MRRPVLPPLIQCGQEEFQCVTLPAVLLYLCWAFGPPLMLRCSSAKAQAGCSLILIAPVRRVALAA